MKKLMITGALIGLTMSMVLGVAQNASWPAILWRSCVACLLAGLMMRWWGNVWMQSLKAAHHEKMAAAIVAQNEVAEKKPTAKSK